MKLLTLLLLILPIFSGKATIKNIEVFTSSGQDVLTGNITESDWVKQAEMLCIEIFPPTPNKLLGLLGSDKSRSRDLATEVLSINSRFQKVVYDFGKNSNDPEVKERCKEIIDNYENVSYLPNKLLKVFKFLSSRGVSYEGQESFISLYLLKKMYQHEILGDNFEEILKSGQVSRQDYKELLEATVSSELRVRIVNSLKGIYPDLFKIFSARERVRLQPLNVEDVFKHLKPNVHSQSMSARVERILKKKSDFKSKEFEYIWTFLDNPDLTHRCFGTFLVRRNPEPFTEVIMQDIRQRPRSLYGIYGLYLENMTKLHSKINHHGDELLSYKIPNTSSNRFGIKVALTDPENFRVKLFELLNSDRLIETTRLLKFFFTDKKEQQQWVSQRLARLNSIDQQGLLRISYAIDVLGLHSKRIDKEALRIVNQLEAFASNPRYRDSLMSIYGYVKRMTVNKNVYSILNRHMTSVLMNQILNIDKLRYEIHSKQYKHHVWYDIDTSEVRSILSKKLLDLYDEKELTVDARLNTLYMLCFYNIDFQPLSTSILQLLKNTQIPEDRLLLLECARRSQAALTPDIVEEICQKLLNSKLGGNEDLLFKFAEDKHPEVLAGLKQKLETSEEKSALKACLALLIADKNDNGARLALLKLVNSKDSSTSLTAFKIAAHIGFEPTLRKSRIVELFLKKPKSEDLGSLYISKKNYQQILPDVMQMEKLNHNHFAITTLLNLDEELAQKCMAKQHALIMQDKISISIALNLLQCVTDQTPDEVYMHLMHSIKNVNWMTTLIWNMALNPQNCQSLWYEIDKLYKNPKYKSQQKYYHFACSNLAPNLKDRELSYLEILNDCLDPEFKGNVAQLTRMLRLTPELHYLGQSYFDRLIRASQNGTDIYRKEALWFYMQTDFEESNKQLLKQVVKKYPILLPEVLKEIGVNIKRWNYLRDDIVDSYKKSGKFVLDFHFYMWNSQK